MARLKFLLFAILVLALWLGHLWLLSPALSSRAVELAQLQAQSAPLAVEAELSGRRTDVAKTALAVAGRPELLGVINVRSVKVEPPAPEKVTGIRDIVLQHAPESIKGAMVVGLINEQGNLFVQGSGAPAAAPAGVDVKALGGAGADGQVMSAFGSPHLFFSFSLGSDRMMGDPRSAGTVVIGAPLMTAGVAEAAAKRSGLALVALVAENKVVDSGGPSKDATDAALKDVAVGSRAVIARGETDSLAGVKLPMMAGAGGAPLLVGVREKLTTMPLEVIGAATVKPFMSELAGYQKLALMSFAGLLLLSLIWLVIMGGAAPAAESLRTTRARDEVPAPTVASPVHPVAVPVAAAPPPPAAPTRPLQTPAPTAAMHPVAPLAAEASPDDFQFPPAGSMSPPPPEPAAAPWSPPAASIEAPWQAAAEPAGQMPAFEDRTHVIQDQDHATTRAYQLDPAASEAFGMAGAPPMEGDFNPDSTRVANVPEELLRQSAKNAPAAAMESARAWAPPPPSVPLAIPLPPPSHAQGGSGGQSAEDQHFQEVYRDFVAMRERCGEPADGLTFDKFVLKLRKNKEQLVSKYNCRTVRFQVYEKEGKAALKATPVKD